MSLAYEMARALFWVRSSQHCISSSINTPISHLILIRAGYLQFFIF